MIIPAAGSGSRMQQAIPKQYLLLNGIAVIEHTLALFLGRSDFNGVRVCLAPDDTVFSTLKSSQHSKVSAVDGGDTRAQSVLNGLRSLDAADDDWVLVHDAARPCLSKKTLDSLLSEVKRNNVGGILAVPAKDTLKRADADKNIGETVDRSTIWQAQTPQMFPYKLLLDCLERALTDGLTITDEASALEAYGHKVKLVTSDARNLKITTPEDIELAEFLLNTGS